MGEPIDLGQDIGYVTVLLDGVEVRLDLFSVNNRLYELVQEHRGKSSGEFYAAAIDYIRSLGFPEVSHHAADRFMRAIWERMKQVKKADAGESRPESPASTD